MNVASRLCLRTLNPRQRAVPDGLAGVQGVDCPFCDFAAPSQLTSPSYVRHFNEILATERAKFEAIYSQWKK
jgi:hypothetical protein